MDFSEYLRLAQIEHRHWWYRSIHSLIVEIFQGSTLSVSRSNLKKPLRILDAGCGTGGLTRELRRFGFVIGIDISSLALTVAHKNLAVFIQGSVNRLPIKNEGIDVVTSISVLYHQKVNDRYAWREMKRVLRPGGIAIVVLPAFSWLAGLHDRATHAKGRYVLSDVIRDSRRLGFEVLDGRYLFSLLFPLFVIKRVAERFGVHIASDVAMPPHWLNALFLLVCRAEWRFARSMRLPFGSSLLLIARKIQ